MLFHLVLYLRPAKLKASFGCGLGRALTSLFDTLRKVVKNIMLDIYPFEEVERLKFDC